MSCKPIKIKNGASNAARVSVAVSRRITEKLNLLSIQGMRGTVCDGMREHIAVTTTDLDW